jgi:Transposase DDE domain
MIRAAAVSGPPGKGEAGLDPVVERYRTFFALLDWSQVTERDAQRRWPGRSPHPRAAYVKALLVKLCEQKAYITDLRRFLVEHPALVLELGFRPMAAPTRPHGFDVERTVPGARWLRHQQQHLDHGILRALLAATVSALQDEIVGLGTTVAIDVKHIYAWVQENNPKAYLGERYDPTRQPHGDPDCRLGVKRATNQDGPARRPTVRKEYLWGYGTGVASATDRWYGDVVLAEWTQPFNEQDVTYYHPLHRQATATLGAPPPNVTADAAFDAWHVYQTCTQGDGIAAIPLNLRGQAPPDRDPQGRPRCAKGLAMVPRHPFIHEDGYRALRHGCPLLFPTPTGQTCDDAHFRTGTGCSKAINLEPGGRMRATLDRQSDAFKAIYRQRTSAERINSQATALGIERPKVRNAQSVRRLNTLTYIVINARALQRARALNAAFPRPPAQC